ncbi:MAG: efflux RND transporter permease subunit, partial [Phycisphaerales bacterium]
MSLPRFGVTRPVPVNLLMATFLVAGIACALTMTREFFPEMTPESASVSLPYPGATPEEIEESLARKVEDKLSDLDEVEKLTTAISEGRGSILVEFRDGVDDVAKATDEVERAIDSLTDLPEEAERIQVAELEPLMHAIMLSLYGEADEAVMKRVIREIRDDLKTLPGMGDVLTTGVRDYEIRVDVSADSLLAHGLSLPHVSDAIRAWMTDVPGGTVRTGVGNINVRTMGVAERAEAIRQIVVKATADGQVLRVGDVADVREYFVDEQIRSSFRTEKGRGPTVGLMVFKVGDQDAVEIAEMVRAYAAGRSYGSGDETAVFEPKWRDRIFEAINWMGAQGGSERAGRPLRTNRRMAYELGLNAPAPLPEGCHLQTHSDLARFIEGRLDLLTRNARWGALLVFLTLLAFLNWRTAFWVGVGLATALAGTLLFMTSAGITLNLMTMFGLIVVLGLLVDDAIVVAENVTARHDRNEPSLVAAIKGTEQVFWPVVATVLTTIVAFAPLLFVKGTIGDLLGALPWVVFCALTMSLIEAVLILPSHMGHSLVHRDRLKAEKRKTWVSRLEEKRDHLILRKLVPAYARLLALCLRYRYISLSLAIAILTISLGMVAGGRLVFTFLATSDSETIIVDLRMPTGTPIEATEAVMRRIEDAAAARPETMSVSTIVGFSTDVSAMSGWGWAGLGTHVGQLFMELKPVEVRQAAGMMDSPNVIAAVRNAVLPLDGIESLKFSEIQGGPGGADITVQVTGEDGDQVDIVVEEVKRLLGTMDGVVDIADDNAIGQREVQIHLKPGAAALGFTVAEVARQVRGALFGFDPHVFSADREDIDVRVRLDEESRRSLQTIENLWIIGQGGIRVPLQEIAELTEGTSYNAIRRVDRKRAISVTADTAPGVSPESVVPVLRPQFERLKRQHPAVGIELAGRQRQMGKAFESLPVGFLAALIGIYVILAWLFSSYVQPLAVMLAIPFGIIGVVWGHLLLGFEMTFLSMIGFVALSGIVVNDSLIFVRFFNDLREEGAGLVEGLIEAGRQRLRPILLTTITTVLGLTPLMLETSFQARFLIPMAISVAFGLMSATALILLIL